MSLKTFDYYFDLVGLYFALAVMSMMLLLLLFMWYTALKQARQIEDIPTSKIPSAAQGYVELIGRQFAPPGHTVKAPLTGTPCTWWRYRVQQRKLSLSGQVHWETLEKVTSTNPILLKNRGGQLLVDPEGADVTPSVTQSWHGDLASPPRPMDVRDVRGGRFLYTEERMHEGGLLYVAGELHTFSGGSKGPEFESAATELLAVWKRDQATLVKRFDTNDDGHIDSEEWDAARDAAKAEVAPQTQRSDMEPDVDVVRRPANGQPFMLSGKSQIDQARIYRSRAADCLLSFFLLGTFFLFSIWKFFHA